MTDRELSVEQKGLLNDIIDKIAQELRVYINFSFIKGIIKSSYDKGITDIEDNLKPNKNFIPNEQAIDFLSKYTFENVKDVNDDLVKRLRKEITQGLMQGESTPQISKRISETMNVGMVRARAIARTETHRAYNYGAAYGAQQSGLKLKKYAYNPNPKSDICQHVANNKPIDMTAYFQHSGEQWQSPPFHVNCRSKLLFVQEEDL